MYGEVADVYDDALVVNAVGDEDGVAGLGAIHGRLNALPLGDSNFFSGSVFVDGRLTARIVSLGQQTAGVILCCNGHGQSRGDAGGDGGEVALIGEGVQEGDEVFALLVGHLEALDEGIYVFLAVDTAAAIGVEVYHFGEGGFGTIVHIRGTEGDVAEGGDFECALLAVVYDTSTAEVIAGEADDAEGVAGEGGGAVAFKTAGGS